jgi:hypothetical protein
MANGKRPAEHAAREIVEGAGEFADGLGARTRAVDGDGALEQRAEEQRAHQRSCPEYEQLKDLLQSGKSATMLFSIAASSSGH